MRLGWWRTGLLAAVILVLAGVFIWPLIRWHYFLVFDGDQTLADRMEPSRLILVETASFSSSDARVNTYVYDRAGKAWRKVGSEARAKIGRAGLGWGYSFRHLAKSGEPIKKEGDKRAPAGVFKVGRPFGLVPDNLPNYMQLSEGEHFCVDDTSSENYSQILNSNSVATGISGERMWEISLYKRGLVVDYQTDRNEKSGSCIFLHVWKSPETPTVGCVATSEETVVRLQKWVSQSPGRAWVAIVPKIAQDRVGLDQLDRFMYYDYEIRLPGADG